MKRIDVYFLLLAAIMLLFGVLLGIHMAMSKDYQLVPVHAHANLVGWASMALFGLTYRAYPGLKDGGLARVHFTLAAASAIVMPYGIYQAVVLQVETLAIISSLVWLAAVIVYLVQLTRLLRQPAD
jgi:hypothetical protein